MGWRTVVVSKPSKIDLRLGYAVIRDVDSTVRVHISEISVMIIETTAVSITTALLAELVKQKVKVKYQGVFVIFLENMFSFERLDDENITIIDKDLCEIVAKDRSV